LAKLPWLAAGEEMKVKSTSIHGTSKTGQDRTVSKGWSNTTKANT
jgi:hypothetical protein